LIFDRELKLRSNCDEDESHPNSKSSIALFFSGLFSSYQFFQFMIKQEFLDSKDGICIRMLQMKKELTLSLSGFMLCLLPALDEETQLRLIVKEILLKTEQIVGTSNFFGEIWKAILRTPRTRFAAIKYLKERIPISPLVGPRTGGQSTTETEDDPDESEQSPMPRGDEPQNQIDSFDKSQISISKYTIMIIDEEVFLKRDKEKEKREEQMRDRKPEMELHDYFYFYFPNKSKLVINALNACLSNDIDQVYTQRATLDFMISHMPISSEINSIEENIKLAESAIQTFVKRDFAINAKIGNWLFEHIEDDHIDDCDPAIIAIVEALKNLFTMSMDMKNKNFVQN